MAWGIMGAQGAKKSDDVSGATESNLNLWSWSLRVTTMWMSTTTRHWDFLELFFEKGTESDAKTTIQNMEGWILKGQGPMWPSFTILSKIQICSTTISCTTFLVQEMGHEMRHVYGNPGNQGDQGNHFPDATLHSGPL